MLLQRVVRHAIGKPAASLDIQAPFDAAVVVQTVLRPSLERAIESIYQQRFDGRIQILVGVDKHRGDRKLLDRLITRCPRNMHVTVFDPGYSTSARHGSVYSNFFGGGLRAILAYAANSRYVAYLDDDDWYKEDHIASLREALEGRSWAFSLRWFVSPYDLEAICIDTWENVGPGKGIFLERFGGFACPSSLMLDKLRCHFVLPHWCNALGPGGDGEDRVMFDALMHGFPEWRSSDEATVCCIIKPEDPIHGIREKFIAETGYDITTLRPGRDHAFRRV